MQVIKRISEFFRVVPKQIPVLKKKETSYKPVTRLQKIRHKDFIYPCSTQKRFVFNANLDGSGFQRQTFQNCPQNIPLVEMLNEINTACYVQWQKNRAHYHRHPFQKLNHVSNFSLVGAILLIILLQILVDDGSIEFLTNYLFIFLCFLATSFGVCLTVYFSKLPEEDTDALMISCIQEKLHQFNQKQMEESDSNPRFMWTSHKECLWIALRI